MGQVREVTAAYHQHYNGERPHQAKPCSNRPPRVAFPTLPTRPPLPSIIDPDGWIHAIGGEHYARQVRSDGRVKLDERLYYVQQTLAGKQVVLEVDGPARELVIWYKHEEIKRVPIKGLQKTLLPWDDDVDQLREEARTEWRRYQQARMNRQASR